MDRWILAAFFMLLTVSSATAEPFQDGPLPFLKKYCVECHNSKKMRGELDLGGYARASDLTRDFRRWNHVIEFIRDGAMPPEKSEQPTIAERNRTVDALESILLEEAAKHAGDPGEVLPRRLSIVEYDLSIRDLTGVDIQTTKEFPADPAAGEGFDNTGEALSMSPSLLQKYLVATQKVSEHLVLKTGGVAFAPFPVTSYNERKKLTEQAIIDFYRAHDVRTKDYLEAAWRYQHAGRRENVDAWAQQYGLSGKYLALVLKSLNEASSGAGVIKQAGEMWRDLPPPTDTSAPTKLAEMERMIVFCREQLGAREDRLIRSNAGNWPIGHLDFRAKTSVARDQFDATRLQSRHLVRFDRIRYDKKKEGARILYLRMESAAKGDGYVIVHEPLFSRDGNLPKDDDDRKKHAAVSLVSVLKKHAPETARQLAFGKHPQGGKIDPESFVVKTPALIEIPLGEPALRQVQDKHLLFDCTLDAEHSPESCVAITYGETNPPDRFSANTAMLIHGDSNLAKLLGESAERFCNAFPNRFFYVDDKRGLAAGFHLVEGFFRDDRPLMEKVLNADEISEINQLWEELDFVTNSHEVLLRGFTWFERSERHVLHDKRFDFLRPESPDLTTNALLDRFEKEYLDKMGIKLKGDTLEPEKPNEKYDMIHGFFKDIRDGLAHRRDLMKVAEKKALADLGKFAARAFRRPLEDREQESLLNFYDRLREQGSGVEDSLRGVLTAILMSPDFCYRYSETAKGTGATSISNRALASRLSYFLWSSLPDEELSDIASRGELKSDEALTKQTRRMLKDPKVESFAREFFGQWLRYRDYLSNDSIVADLFPGYTDELRLAMFEEPTRLATWLIQNDRPITDLLNSDATFVNEVLARHYGGDISRQYDKNGAEWQQVRGLHKAGRGGLFGMGVVLTKNSAGQRTSPVKRGFWAVHHLLGQHFPPPPSDVPELPANEKKAAKTIRELLSEHTANSQCAICHTHFDSLGLAMEGFDPIGRLRTKDLAARPIDNTALLPNGKTATGVPGLIEYIEQHRRDDFVKTFCRKFLGYALGRSVMLSDKPLLLKMEAKLKEHDYRFSALFETVVKSSQFRKQRGSEFVGGN